MIACSIAKFRERLADLLNLAVFKNERILITRSGKTVAALISIEELEEYERLEQKEDNRIASKRLRDLESGREELVSWESIKERHQL